MVIETVDVSSSSSVVSYKHTDPGTASSSSGGSCISYAVCSCSECTSSVSDNEEPHSAAIDQLISIENGSAKNLTINIPIDQANTTVLDMHVVDHQETKKLKDDSKVHHILDDAMFKPRKRFTHNNKHNLHDESALFHHNIRQNLRHIISRNKGEHGHGHGHHGHGHHGHGHHGHGHHGHPRHHSKKKLVEKDDEEEPRKNVSFANSGVEITVSKPKVAEEDPDDQGITFTVSEKKDTPENECRINMDDYSPQTTITRTVAETTLPWKNFNNRNNPVSSFQSMLALANGDEPCPGEAPTWLADPETNQLTVMPISMLGHDLRCNMSESAINEKVTVIHFRRQARAADTTNNLSSTLSAPQLLDSSVEDKCSTNQKKPDILNCSNPNEEILRKNKIDDFHEGAPNGDLVVEDTVIDLRQNTQVIQNGSPEDKLDFNGSVNGWSSQSHTSGTDDCYLPATWRTNSEHCTDGADDNKGEAEVDSTDCGPAGQYNPVYSQDINFIDTKLEEDGGEDEEDEDRDQTNLPPPWKNQSDSSEEGAQRAAVYFEIGVPSENTSVRSLPWENNYSHHHPRHHHHDNTNPVKAASAADLRLQLAEDASMDEIDQSSMKCLSDHDAEDCIPPPWRSVNVSEGSVPVRSPSASHELDSLFPQASHNSLRLSEAESRHSEQFRGHHHVIDIAPRELEHTTSTSSPALSAMVGAESEPIDLVSRVELWLLSTKLDQQDPVPDDLYIEGSAEFEGEIDFVDCEDTIL